MINTDVLIIGSGAGGSPLALRLSESGLNVIVLEKGSRYERSDLSHDETWMAMHPNVFVPPLDRDPHVVIDHSASDPAPHKSTFGWIACCVGGGTARMGATFHRFHPHEFNCRSRHGAFEEVEDWPYGYEDLETYYSQAEWEIGVSGSAGANAFEGPRSRPYPLPPLQSHALAAVFDTACTKLGLHPYPTARAINSRPYGDRPACAYCDYCAGYGCPTGARGGTQESLLPRGERTGRCRIISRAMVRKVTMGRWGRATGCIYIDESGKEQRVRARIVCVCCSAVESARLLLMSKSRSFPDGLANGSGLVGRHLQFHATSSGRARFHSDMHSRHLFDDRNRFLGRSVMDFYFLPPRVSEFSSGGLLRFDLVRVGPIRHALTVARDTSGRWLWGEPLRECLREVLREYLDLEFEVFQDFLPNSMTFVELDPELTDQWGLPVARIHLRQPSHHRLAGQWVANRGMEILNAMGADEVFPGGIGYINDFMAHGTCRAGIKPSSSVLNEFCQAHEVPNLFVVDGSFMPTSGTGPTTLTILANSFRTADYILDRARVGAFP